MNEVKKELRLKITTSVTEDLPQDLPHMIGVVVLKQQDGELIFLFHFFFFDCKEKSNLQILARFSEVMIWC